MRVKSDSGREPNASDEGVVAPGAESERDVDPVSSPPLTEPSARRRSEPGPGQRIGRYIILGSLGRGGMGTVLRAYDESLDRVVALKLLHSEAAERHAPRLRREAQALARLSHPNVVQVYEVGEDERWFIAMELVQGVTLRAWQKGDASWRDRVRVYLEAGAGLAAAHAAGMVHRDFKPDNCVLDEQGRPRVMDFGLVRETDVPSEAGSQDEPAEIVADALEDSLTKTGAILGTPAYMPPEQLGGKPADARSDQFSFCVSLYEALYGERPFGAETLAGLTVALLEGRVRSAPRGTRVPITVRRILLRGLSAQPSERWPSMDALLEALRRVVAPRRWGLPLTILGAGLMAVGVGLWSRTGSDAPCDDGTAELSGVWDPARRQAVEDAIVGTRLRFADQTWSLVAEDLDGYAARWTEAYIDACEATRVRQEQSIAVMDLRMQCLAEHRTSLGSVVDLLAETDVRRAEKAVELVARLPALRRCADVEALRSDVPPPDDPELARRVQRHDEDLFRLESRFGIETDYQMADELAAAVEAADRLEYRPLLARAIEVRGRFHQSEGRYPLAEQDLERAHLMALELGDEPLAAVAAGGLSFVVGHQQGRYVEGLQWGKVALALARGLPEGSDVLPKVMHGYAVVLSGYGRPDEALEMHRHALVLRRANVEPGHHSLAPSLSKIGNLLMQQGKYDEALEYLEEALAIREKVYGTRHPEVARSVNQIGNIALSEGRHTQALEHYQRARTLGEAALGQTHPYVVSIMLNEGNALSMLGRPEEALERLQHARRLMEQGTEHTSLPNVLQSIGLTLQQLGRLEDALPYFERALAIVRVSLPPGHPNLATALSNLGRLLVDMERYDEAWEPLRRAQEIRDQALPPEHLHHAWSLVGLARVALWRGEQEMAREYAQRALELREAGTEAADLIAEARFVLAQTLWPDPSQRAQARTQAERVRRTYAEVGGAPERLARVEQWLATHPADASESTP